MRTLSELSRLPIDATVIGAASTPLTSIEHDSRQVKPGTLFVCIKGAHVDGHNFIPQAVAQGATAIMTDTDITPPEGVAVLRVKNLAAALKIVVPYFYDFPTQKMRVIGITGTNGKTTTSYLLRDILRTAGFKVGLIGTIQTMIENEIFPTHNTTPDVVELTGILNRMAERGMDYAVMEVSSHALDQDRVAGIEFDTAVFTNLTQDHLDYHRTMENYRAAKAKLFTLVSSPGVKKNKTVVVNADDPAGEFMLGAANCPAITYGLENDAKLTASEVQILPSGNKFNLSGDFGTLSLTTHLTGKFNVYNVMAAVGAALAEHIDPAVIKAAVGDFKSVAGRFQPIKLGQDYTVIVDYAHTPDGVENVIKTARQIALGHRVIAVFGCGGDRDNTKRPIMGRLAAELADIVIATSDNPRSEDPAAILAQVEVGVKEKIGTKHHECIIDRREAIFRAVELAETGDIVVILGKGHENYQILKDKTIHFDDREVAGEAIKQKHDAKK